MFNAESTSKGTRLGRVRAAVRPLALAALLAVAVVPTFALAGQGYRGQSYSDRHNDRGHDGGGDHDNRGYVIDRRYGHNHYYPPRGYAVGVLPRGYVTVNYRGGPYYYHGGVFYRHTGGRYFVVRPAIGLYVPFLPSFYTTVWWGGAPYYYADDVYYAWRPGRNAYEVVNAPGDAQGVSTTAPAGATSSGGDLFVYPKNGQSEDQQGKDKYECHSWATSQSGFDPTQPSGGVAENQASSKRDDYQRAMQACLEARGYSVK